MFESRYIFRPTKLALAAKELQKDYDKGLLAVGGTSASASSNATRISMKVVGSTADDTLTGNVFANARDGIEPVIGVRQRVECVGVEARTRLCGTDSAHLRVAARAR